MDRINLPESHAEFLMKSLKSTEYALNHAQWALEQAEKNNTIIFWEEVIAILKK